MTRKPVVPVATRSKPWKCVRCCSTQSTRSDFFSSCATSATRNQVRVPVYARLDVRANRTFNYRSRRLTLFVEVLNAFARDNVRMGSPGINVRTRQVFNLYDSMIPLMPSAGILFEF